MRVAQSEDARESSGISIFLPDNATSAGAWYTTPYNSFDQQTGWSQLLGVMGGNGRGDGGSGSGRSVVSPDWSEQNDVAAQAFNLNTLVGSENTFPGLGLHATDDVDWFRLALGAPGGPGNAVTTTPTGDSTAAIRLTLWDSAGTSLLETSQNGPGPQMVSLDGLATGNYLLRADSPQTGSITGYDLVINAPDGDASSDWAGGNSSQDKAWHLGTIGNRTLFSGLGVSAIAEDWLDTGRCDRVIVISGDDSTGDDLMEWIGAGFAAAGAHSMGNVVEEVALPFDVRRNGMLLGMGGAAFVVEKSSHADDRGVVPYAELLGGHIGNSAFQDQKILPIVVKRLYSRIWIGIVLR